MTDIKIEMYDSFEESAKKLNDEAAAIRDGFQALVKYSPYMSVSFKTGLRIHVDHAIGIIRHNLSELVQQNERIKDPNRTMDFSGLREQNGFDAVDSQLAELTGSNRKKKS